MTKLKPKTRKVLLVVSTAFSMILIIILWMVISPPEYFKKTNQDGFFDTIKSEFSDVL